MSESAKKLKQRLLAILKDEYEGCQFFMAASNILTNKIADLTETIQSHEIEFNNLRDSIGEIGLFISNTEKRLEEVEECYTKLVDALAKEKPRKK